MNRGWRVWRQTSAGVAAIALGVLLQATCMRAADDAGQPASRAVRLGSVEGHVQVLQGDQMLADPALANMPLFEGTRVVTLDDGRAEIQLEDGSLARLSPNSSLTLSVLRGQAGSAETEMVQEGGLGYFELQAAASPIRVEFSDVVVTATSFTVLRVNLDNPPGEVAVFSGSAHVERGGASLLDLRGGESVALNSADGVHYSLSESIEPDSWDTWNADRDQALQTEYATQTGATKNLPDSNNPAWADLDANGSWYNVPDQGLMWSPNEASSPDWDPYGDGYWMPTPRYGYMWVSGNAWGYLPYQCGSWNYFDAFGWGWAPGMCRPWWAGGGWFSNIGLAPGGYRPPRRPGPHPIQPRRPVNPAAASRTRLAANPVIPVSRHLSGITGTLPARGRNTPVVIAGHAVEPLERVVPRTAYDHSNPIYGNRVQPVYAGRTGQHPASGVDGNHPGNPQPSRGTGASQHSAPASHTFSGGSASSHSSAPASGGGGGGGGSHGGGGGGGGSHR